MQKLIAEKEYHQDRISGRFVAGLVIAVILLSIVRVFLANWLVESSETLRTFDRKIASQIKENQSLAESLREKSSLVAIESQAKGSGYIRGTKLTFIAADPSVALLQTNGL